MSIKEGVTRVLREYDAAVLEAPVEHSYDLHRVMLEDRRDGTTALRLAGADDFFDDALQHYADLCADAGFLVAMLKDDRGVFISLS